MTLGQAVEALRPAVESYREAAGWYSEEINSEEKGWMASDATRNACEERAEELADRMLEWFPVIAQEATRIGERP